MKREQSDESLPLDIEARVKAVLFQYVKLYERWSEDRQAFLKNVAEHEELLATFNQQLEQLVQLEPHLRQQMMNSIAKASQSMAENVGEKVGSSAVHAIDDTVRQLKQILEGAASTLKAYQTDFRHRALKTWGITIGTTLAASLLIVWLLIPKPMLALTPDALGICTDGVILEKAWPYLSYNIQQQIKAASSRTNQTSSSSMKEENISTTGIAPDESH